MRNCGDARGANRTGGGGAGGCGDPGMGGRAVAGSGRDVVGTGGCGVVEKGGCGEAEIAGCGDAGTVGNDEVVNDRRGVRNGELGARDARSMLPVGCASTRCGRIERMGLVGLAQTVVHVVLPSSAWFVACKIGRVEDSNDDSLS